MDLSRKLQLLATVLWWIYPASNPLLLATICCRTIPQEYPATAWNSLVMDLSRKYPPTPCNHLVMNFYPASTTRLLATILLQTFGGVQAASPQEWG